MKSKDMTIDGYAVYKTNIGNLRIDYTSEVITQVTLVEDNFDKGQRSELSNRAYQQIQEYLTGNRKVFDLPIRLDGTVFQKQVWKALMTIGYGQTATYKEIAQLIGNDKAARAVGGANHKNPILIVVPCHRVVGANGKLVGYAGGLDIKQYLLNLEK